MALFDCYKRTVHILSGMTSPLHSPMPGQQTPLSRSQTPMSSSGVAMSNADGIATSPGKRSGVKFPGSTTFYKVRLLFPG